VRIALVALASLLAPVAWAQAPAPPLPATAVAALDRATAAYDYGDMTQVVEATRPIVEGALPATPEQRLTALRLLGVGLYLTGRPTGAEAAFVELLRDSRRARLDPTTTRPEVVAFFEDVRRRHAAEIHEAARVRSRHSIVWNFFPPLGQLKNGDTGRAWLFGGLEVASLATALTTRLILGSWHADHDEFPGHHDAAGLLKTINYASVGVLTASTLAGITDAFMRGDRDPDEPEAALSFHLLPLGAAVSGRF
jgi:hypothetical protein